MKCQACYGDGAVTAWTRSGFKKCHICNGKGWLPFWTEAERAGIKAMGTALRMFHPSIDYPGLEDGLRAHRGAIRAYVKSARAAKEKT